MKRILAVILSAAVMIGCPAVCACHARASAAAIGQPATDPVFYGDANRDGERDMKDVLRLRRFIARLEDIIDEEAADVNRDGQVNMKDVLVARRCIAGLDEWPVSDVGPESSGPESSEEPSEAVSDERSEEESEASVSEEPSDEPSENSDDTIIYDADVDVTLTLSPGRTYWNADIGWAFELEWMTHGIADYYTVTARMEAEATDYVYPIILGGNDAAEAWPVREFESAFRVEGDSTVFGTVAGSVFDSAGSAPRQLFFYSESGHNTITLRHITIQVIRRETQPTEPTTPTTAPTAPTAAPTLPGGLTRASGPDAYTVVDGVPYITFRSYSDEGMLGVWWWGMQDAEDPAVCDAYLDFLYKNGTNEIFFYGYYWCTSAEGRDKLHTFVQKANVYGMVVSLIYDEADAIASRRNLEMTRIANNYLSYCAAYPTDQLSGIHFDVEPYSQESKINYMVSQFADARARGVRITMDVNCFWNGNFTLNGVTGFKNIVAANVDCLSLMSYRDTAASIWNMGADWLAAAKTYGTRILFGVETGDSTEGNHVDFSAESKREVATELAGVYSRLAEDHPSGGYGIAVHHVRVWYALKNE